MNLAICSPNKNAYSETFIQAHKEYLRGNKFCYSGAELPNVLEGEGVLLNSRKRRIWDIIKGHYRLNTFDLKEQALLKSFKNRKIDVVLAEYGGTGEKLVPICKELNIPLIVHFHGHDATRKSEIERNGYYKGIFDYASYIVCVSLKMEENLLELGCPKEKLIYNTYGPRKLFFDIQPKFNSKQFIALGRFVDKKAPYYLILSFLKVLKDFPDSKLIIAGDGPLRNACINLSRYYKIQDNIEFPGVIDHAKYACLLEKSIAFVQHSIITLDGDSEGTPVSILEASAAALPVISTKHAGITDVIENSRTGFIVEEHDVDEMAEKMKLIIKDISNAKKMGSLGRENIKQNFNLERHIHELQILLEKV